MRSPFVLRSSLTAVFPSLMVRFAGPLLALLGVLATLWAPSVAAQDGDDALVAQAIAAYEARENERAMAIFEEAYALAPNPRPGASRHRLRSGRVPG